MGGIEIFLTIVVIGASTILLLVSMMAWIRTGSVRNALLTFAFFVMGLKGVVILWFISTLMFDVPLWVILIDLFIVLLFYSAVVIRGEPHAGKG